MAISLLACAVLSGCSEPVKKYAFQDLPLGKGWTEGEPIELELDIKEGSEEGCLYLCAQILDSEKINGEHTLPVALYFIAPDNKRYCDTLALPIDVCQKKNVYNKYGTIVEIQWPYMQILNADVPGRWKIILNHTGNHLIYNHIIGLGASFKNNEHDK